MLMSPKNCFYVLPCFSLILLDFLTITVLENSKILEIKLSHK